MGGALIRSTIELFRDAAKDASGNLVRSAVAILGLAVAPILLFVVSALTAPLGLAGGFIYGFLHAGAVGWYLSLVGITITERRAPSLADVQRNLGTYLWEVISVLFVFWIGSMVLGFVSSTALFLGVIVATLVFNPVPEMIYQERSRSLELLGEAAKFMQRNWPEWIGAHILPAALLTAWGMLFMGGGWLEQSLTLFSTFGPFFGFIDTALLPFGVAGGFLRMAEQVRSTDVFSAFNPLQLIGAILLIPLLHFVMLFRGFLYRRLRGSSRRSRAWQDRNR